LRTPAQFVKLIEDAIGHRSDQLHGECPQSSRKAV
jgi:hypothetical protein